MVFGFAAAESFTEDSKEILTNLGLEDKNFVLDTEQEPEKETISWSQMLSTRTETYLLCTYHQDGDKTRPVLVYVSEKYGSPPESFSSSGHEEKLHFGYLYNSVFFVIHDNDLRPYQHRFETNSYTEGGTSN